MKSEVKKSVPGEEASCIGLKSGISQTACQPGYHQRHHLEQAGGKKTAELRVYMEGGEYTQIGRDV